jgi:hypothetical protein
MGMKPPVRIVPSHKTHMVIGSRMCGFYNREIDVLIDESREEDAGEEELHELVIPLSSIPGGYLVIEGDVSGRNGHDASRVSCGVLLSQARLVFGKLGDKGLCYYILHHYLDKFIDILVGQILSLYSKYKDRENAFDLVYDELISSFNEIVRRGYETEASTFKALELILDKGFKDTYEDVWKALINVLDLNADYKSSTRSTKSAIIIATWRNCLDNLVTEDDWRLARQIVDESKRVREKLVENSREVICILLKHRTIDPYLRKRFSKLFDEKRMWMMLKAFSCP